MLKKFRKRIISWKGDVSKFRMVWLTTKDTIQAVQAATLRTWFRQKCPMSPDKVRFRFVNANCVSGYMHDISHFVTNEVTTAKPVQIHPLTQKPQNLYADVDSTTLKKPSKKIGYWENGFDKSFFSLLKT